MKKSAPRRHSQVVGAGGTYDWSSSPVMLDDARQSPWSLGRKPPVMYRKASEYNPNTGPSRSWLGGAVDALRGWYDRASWYGDRVTSQNAANAAGRAKPDSSAYTQRPSQAAPAGFNRPAQFFAEPGAAVTAQPGQAYNTFYHQGAQQRFRSNYQRAMAAGDEEAANRWKDTSGFDALAAYRMPDPMADINTGGVGPGSRMQTTPRTLPFDVSKPMDEYQRELYLADLSATHGANVGAADMARYNGGMEFDSNGMLRPYAEARADWHSKMNPGVTPEQLMEHGYQVGPMGAAHNVNWGGEALRDELMKYMFPYMQRGYNPRQAYEMARDEMVQTGFYMPDEAGWNAWEGGWSPRDKAWFNQVAESGRAAHFSTPGGANGLGYYLRNPAGALAATVAGPLGLNSAVGWTAGLAADQFQDPFYKSLAGGAAGIGTWGGGMSLVNRGLTRGGRYAAAKAPGLAAGASKTLSGLGRLAGPAVGVNNIIEGGTELWDAGRAADLHAFMTGGRREGYNDRDYQAVSGYRQLGRQMPGNSPYSDIMFGSVIQPAVTAVNQVGERLMRPDDPETAEMTTQRWRNDRLVNRTLEMYNDPMMAPYAQQQILSMMTPEVQERLLADPATLEPMERDWAENLQNALDSLDYSSPLDRRFLIEQLRRNGVFAATGD